MNKDSCDELKVLQRSRAKRRQVDQRRLAIVDELVQCNTHLQEAKWAEERALISYAQSRMRSLAQALFKKLPRELRDQVYVALWDPIIKAISGLKLPPFATSGYMGAAVADEVVSHLYRESLRKCKQPIWFNRFPVFLTFDPFGRGFCTLDWIQELNITWGSFDVCKSDVTAASCGTLAGSGFPVSTPVCLTLNNYQYNEESFIDQILPRLETFKPAFKVLVRKGHTVVVKDGKLGVDLSGFYTMPKKVWVKDMEGAIKRWSKERGSCSFRL
ncbi:hypothetical protein CC86DRAFT_399925 [Ophiobolus disseminans]|uniref:Uncharacterized protein n=1 Tax=Ophiobolus disseminans TaxID=1469910 RepID=A0A6A7AK00_9PLEO|nr:hypothetical protein CC86DRAFT_399925 [Ophiobolus disseminans]